MASFEISSALKSPWINSLKNSKQETTIALVGKYIELKDSYKSIVEALYHAGVKNKCKINIKWVHSEDLVKNKINNTYG